MGLLDFLSPALNVASNAAGTAQGAYAQGAEQNRNAVIQSLMFARQQRQMEIENALKQAQTGEAQAKIPYYQARGEAAGRPKYSAPVIGPHGEVQVYDTSDPTHTQTVPGIQGNPHKPNYAPPVIGPNGEVQLINEDDPLHPIRVPGVKGKVEYPPKYVADPGGAGRQPVTREAYILKRLPMLTKGTKGIGGLPQPGMSVEDATNQAGLEYDKANGVPPSTGGGQGHGQQTGDINLGAAQSDFDQAASLYQQALKQPGVDPEHVRQVYNAAVAKIARKHGMMK